MSEVQLLPEHRNIVVKILKEHLSSTFVFGSRAKGTAKKLSDLDLVIKASLSKSTVRKLQDQFEESDLPFKVDLILWSEIDESFQNHIKNDLVKLS